jgi:hypothetical protein
MSAWHLDDDWETYEPSAPTSNVATARSAEDEHASSSSG